MDIAITLASLTVGIVIGLVIALFILFKKGKAPVPMTVDKLEAWKHLEELAKRKAELLATKRTLNETFKEKKIDEKTFVEEGAKLDSLIESVEDEMEKTMFMIAKGMVPDFMLDARKEVVELEKAIKLYQAYKKLKEELEKVKTERDSLYVKLEDAEEDKKELKAKYNWLEENTTKTIYNLQEKLKELEKEATRLRNENEFLKGEIGEATKPESEKLKNLRNENKLLRENLNSLKERVKQMEKEIEVLLTMISRYSRTIKEKEEKSVEELKKLIKPRAQVIKDLVKTYNDAIKIYTYVRDHVSEVELPIETPFWMKLDEIVRIGAGDNHDRAVLLCSMLRAIGEDAQMLIAEMSTGENRAFVLLKKAGKVYLLDPSDKLEFDAFKGKTEKDAIKSYKTKHGKIVRPLYKIDEKKAVVY